MAIYGKSSSLCIIIVGACNAEIYPPDFAACDNSLLRFTYNKMKGLCEIFEYEICGQERQGYNVFEDIETCEEYCIRLDDPGDRYIIDSNYSYRTCMKGELTGISACSNVASNAWGS